MKKDAAQLVRYLKGVGDTRMKQLEKLNIYRVEDLLEYYPVRYEDRSNLTKIAALADGETYSVYARIISKSSRKTNSKHTILTIVVSDGSGCLNLVFFNQQYRERFFRQGDIISAYGKVNRNYFGISMNNPEYEIFPADSEAEQSAVQGIVPVYRQCDGINSKYLRKIIAAALHEYDLTTALPVFIEDKYNLISKSEALHKIHFPDNFADIELAKQRLIFEEFFLLQCCVTLHRQLNKKKRTGIILNNDTLAKSLLKLFPFDLTKAQKSVWREIKADLGSNIPAERLIQGDVGSGKTALSALAMALAAGSGYQAAIMVPTEVLAKQHYESVADYFKQLGLETVLITGKTKAIQKIKEQVAVGKIKIIIGTHALIQDSTIFSNLGLVITDEQHRFGVEQRNKLRGKGNEPHMLVMTATPIPRTLSLSLYGDMDISTIRELPPGRKPVKTYLRDNSRRAAVYEFARNQIAAGRQIFVICPLIEESEKLQAQSAKSLYEELKYSFFSKNRCVLMHGQLRSAEKDAAMHAFSEQLADVMVATTVVEVGINVPKASVIIVEGAERFGLSQLHQLRGRVGRSNYQSYCILLSSSSNPESLNRLEAFTACNDGFEIADTDLLLRGTGHIFGARQHGVSDLKIGNLLADYKIMLKCRAAALEILELPNGNELLQKILIKKYGFIPELIKN